MEFNKKNTLKRLGSGEPINKICHDIGLTEDEFTNWWEEEIKSRVPDFKKKRKVTNVGTLEIVRDQTGTPHIYANTAADLFYGYGFAMAQDRLWQLDYLKRKAIGRLSEILGKDGLEADIISRTVGLNRIADKEINRIPIETKQLLESFSKGINTVIEESKNNLPIEFDLLDYSPETWTPEDSIAIWAEFRWYLTGRLPIISFPEVARRALNNDELYQSFLIGEADDESIVPPGHYPPDKNPQTNIGNSVNDPNEGLGSNNWVIGGKLSKSGLPILASDPHIAFGSVSCWYQAHLIGDGFNTVGAGYIGVPGILFGRNEKVAWGLTNNICAQRDLYYEKENPEKPNYFLYDNQWEKVKEISETIFIKDQDPITKTILLTRNGPIANDILPDVAKTSEPISLKWMGHEPCDEITSMLNFNRSHSASQFRTALQTWIVPTWSFGFADTDGNFGYQSAGRIPVKHNWERGYRPGWDPEHQWNESIPFSEMPKLENPAQGWIRSANNRLAPQDFPYPLSGVWSSGHRAKRIREMIEAKDKFDQQDVAKMQTDSLSLRAVECLPDLINKLKTSNDPKIKDVITHLEQWDCRMETDRTGAAIFESFFYYWGLRVAKERFKPEVALILGTAIAGLSVNLLNGKNLTWFHETTCEKAILETMLVTIDDLSSRLGPDISNWTWGSIHRIQLDHQLADRGEIFKTLSKGGDPVRGNGITVCNTGFDPNYLAGIGANYRINASLADNPPGLWSVDTAGQSGHPGSENYCDQLNSWLKGNLYYIPLDRARVEQNEVSKIIFN